MFYFKKNSFFSRIFPFVYWKKKIEWSLWIIHYNAIQQLVGTLMFWQCGSSHIYHYFIKFWDSQADSLRRQSAIHHSAPSADGCWWAGQDRSCCTLERNWTFCRLLALSSAGWWLIWRPISSCEQRHDGNHDYVLQVCTSYSKWRHVVKVTQISLYIITGQSSLRDSFCNNCTQPITSPVGQPKSWSGKICFF